MAAEFAIPSILLVVDQLQQQIEAELRAADYSDRDICVIRLALEEAFANAITHGNQADSEKWVHVAYTITSERFDIRITDGGEGFDYERELAPPSPTDPHILEGPRGRGLLLMRGFMTDVQYHGKGNIVSMSKVREVAAS